MFSPGDLFVLWLFAGATVTLLFQQRRQWQRTAAQVDAGARQLSRGRWWSIVAFTTVAAVLCGVAARLTASGTIGPSTGPTLILVVDVSRSMYASDIEPSRLERAKTLLEEVVAHAAGLQLAVVAFAGGAATVCPRTVDHDAVRAAIRLLNEDMAPVTGTSIGTGLSEAMETVGTSIHDAAILLVTDGENLEGAADTAVGHARERRIPVHVLAVGTTEGAPVPPRLETGNTGSRQTVITRLDDAVLKGVARDTGGYYASATPDGLVNPTEEIDAWMSSMVASTTRSASRHDLAYRYVALIALGLLTTATVLASRP